MVTCTNWASVWQRFLSPKALPLRSPSEGQAVIHRYDPIDNAEARVRCRDRARYHLGRARRAKDRGQYEQAAREIGKALQHDDTSEAYFQVLGQCHLRREPADLAAARRAFERALTMNPRNGYSLKLLVKVLEAAGDIRGILAALERARAAGAPRAIWEPLLKRYERQPAAVAEA